MTAISEKLSSMIEKVAKALGPDLLNEVAFVGGCTTGFLITDELVKEEVRYTHDVDLIVDVMGYAAWNELCDKLRSYGFRESMENGPICRMILGELQVDFMPVDPNLLGFSNKWYSKALATSEQYKLKGDIYINLLTPPLFVATKLEAYLGRGNNDPIESQDIEDIINLFDGRDELVSEIMKSDDEIKAYISVKLGMLLKDPLFQVLIDSQTRNSPGRSEVLYERLEAVCEQ
ncbi:hypothetical protein [Desulfosediminicola flagellatus]|uniref:hypothetical protein n=1 Tax=Desulfosediminicola flagellatus TaxID=2569541 RepID=UPI0010AC39EF|nr:hypothetical protein [Desulfosediminicola flagellatus]